MLRQKSSTNLEDTASIAPLPPQEPYTPKSKPQSSFKQPPSLVHNDVNGLELIPLAQRLRVHAVKRPHLRECMAECLGMFVLLSFGMAVNNQVYLSGDTRGTWASINVCWGIGVMLGVHVCGGVSGAHMNPAVTITFALFNRFPWRKVPGYLLAQVIGAFCGAAAIYVMYRPLILNVDPDKKFMNEHFAPYPRDLIPNATAFYTEFFATGMLLLGVFAIEDKLNKPGSKYSAPFAFFLLIAAIGMAFGMNTGYAINPARDFGPRLFTCLAGWGTDVFTRRDYYFWIPLVAPTLGGPVGGALYTFLVEMHHPPQNQPELPR